MPYRVFGERTPICDECGAYVAKKRRHSKWHKKNKMAPPVKDPKPEKST